MNINLNIPYPLQVFVFGNDENLGNEIASLLKIKPSGSQIQLFADGERLPHPTETVRGRDVFIIFTSLIGEDINKWALDYLRFVRAIKNGQPHKITVVLPKLLHQRQDVEDQELRQPKMTEFFPELLKACGMDCMIVCKLHNSASSTTNPPMTNVGTTWTLINQIKLKFPDLSKIVIAAADLGGAKYARKIAKELSVPLIIVDKDRDSKSKESEAIQVYRQGKISPDIDTVIFVDDIISTFGSLRNASFAVSEELPQISKYIAVATHADFNDQTVPNIVESNFSELYLTNTVPIPESSLSTIRKSGRKIEIISIGKLVARTIDNLHNGLSISALWIKNGNDKG